MTRAAAVAFALALAACGESVPSARPSAAAPGKIEFRANPVALGARFDDERPQAVIGLRNVGGSALRVERVDANCGCIALGDAPKTVAPGGDADLKFEIRLAGMTGKVARHVTVHTDDPSSPLARVTIEADVRPRIEASPTLVELRPATLGAATAVDLDVRGATGEDLAKLTATSTTTAVKATTTVSGKSARVRVEAAPFVDDFTSAVVLRLGDAERVIPVKAVSARDVRAVPDRVFAAGKIGAKTGETKLVAKDGVVFKVRGLEADSKWLTSEIVDDTTIRVTVVDGAPAGEFKGALTVLLDGARPDRVRIDVTAWIESK